jgi:sugar phosphate permease
MLANFATDNPLPLCLLLPAHRYVTFTLLTVAEVSAQLMTAVIADKAGRHVILSCGLLVSGTACLACSSTTHATARAALAVIGKYGCTGGWGRLLAFQVMSACLLCIRSPLCTL